MNMLLDTGGNDLVMKRNEKGQSILHTFAYFEFKECLPVIKRIINLGRENLLKMQDHKGNTILHQLSKQHSISIEYWKILAINAQIILTRNDDGRTALDLAIENKTQNCIEILEPIIAKERHGRRATKTQNVKKIQKNNGYKMFEQIRKLPSNTKTVLCISTALSQVSKAWKVISMNTLHEYCSDFYEHFEDWSTHQFNDSIVILENAGMINKVDDNAGLFKVGVQLEDVNAAVEKPLLGEGTIYKRILEYVREKDTNNLAVAQAAITNAPEQSSTLSDDANKMQVTPVDAKDIVPSKTTGSASKKKKRSSKKRNFNKDEKSKPWSNALDILTNHFGWNVVPGQGGFVPTYYIPGGLEYEYEENGLEYIKKNWKKNVDYYVTEEAAKKVVSETYGWTGPEINFPDKNSDWQEMYSTLEFIHQIKYNYNGTARCKKEFMGFKKSSLTRNVHYFETEDDLKEFAHNTYGWVGPVDKPYSPGKRRLSRQSLQTENENNDVLNDTIKELQKEKESERMNDLTKADINNQLKDEIKQLQDIQQSLQSKVQEQQVVIENLQDERKQADLEFEIVKTMHEENKNAYEQSLVEVRKLKKVERSQQEDIRDQKELIQNLQYELGQTDEEYTLRLRMLEEENQRLRDFNIKEEVPYTNKPSSIQEEGQRLIEEVKTNIDEVSSIENRVRSLEEENKTLKDVVKEQKQMLTEKQNENNALKDENERLIDKIATSSSKRSRCEETEEIDCIEEDEDDIFCFPTKRRKLTLTSSETRSSEDTRNKVASLESENEELINELENEKASHMKTLRRLKEARKYSKKK